jgi:hypothetical protein
MQEPPQQVKHTFAKRLLWLILCTLAGLAIAFVGQALTGSEVWFLALPASITLGWLVFGTPTECVEPGAKHTRHSPPQ